MKTEVIRLISLPMILALIMLGESGCIESTAESKGKLQLEISYHNASYYSQEIAQISAFRVIVTPLDGSGRGQDGIFPIGEIGGGIEIFNGTTNSIQVEALSGKTIYFSSFLESVYFPSGSDRTLKIELFDVLAPEPLDLFNKKVAESPYAFIGDKERETGIYLGPKRAVEIDQMFDFTVDLYLKPGENDFEFFAFDRGGNFSKPTTVTINYYGKSDCYDFDLDGYADWRCGGFDCNDDKPYIHPGAYDAPFDGVDSDCIGGDNLDRDGDGRDSIFFGGADCDDQRADTYPGAVEICGDSVDQNCDGFAPDCHNKDIDGDGFTPYEGDCDDADPNVRPDAVEKPYTGVDEDCDRMTPDDDLDGDGYLAAQDCREDNPNINPGQWERYGDEIDDNCDGLAE